MPPSLLYPPLILIVGLLLTIMMKLFLENHYYLDCQIIHVMWSTSYDLKHFSDLFIFLQTYVNFMHILQCFHFLVCIWLHGTWQLLGFRVSHVACQLLWSWFNYFGFKFNHVKIYDKYVAWNKQITTETLEKCVLDLRFPDAYWPVSFNFMTRNSAVS